MAWQRIVVGGLMVNACNRRKFIARTVAAGLGFNVLDAPLGLRPVAAAEAAVTPDLVRFGDDIEPLVRLIEKTPREKCVEMLAEQLRRGTSYRQFMAALFLAGLRSFKPAATGGMHVVYLVHSAHQLSVDGRAEDRLLPLFFALDLLKSYTENPRRRPPPEDLLPPVRGSLPPAEKAWDEFRAGMDDWDGERADRAMAALVRSRGAHELAEGLWRYGARDIRHDGHKAIFLANAWRTLETIGWQHAEPVLRAVTLSLVSHRMQYAQPKAEYQAGLEKQPYFPNLERVRKAASRLRADWAAAQSDPGATNELLALLRYGRTNDACDLAVTQLIEGKARAGALWDAVHLAAGELMMRKADFATVHAVTSANALHYAFRMSGQSENRLLIALQALGWMCSFQYGVARLKFMEVDITQLAPGEIPASEDAAARDVFAALQFKGGGYFAHNVSTGEAARKAFQYAHKFPQPETLFQEGRRLICQKAIEEHMYKYPAAIFEDYQLVSPQWRPHMLAASVYFLRGSGLPDAPVIQRAREALGG